MIIRFNPDGRVCGVFGRRQESADEHGSPLGTPGAPLPHVDGLFRQPTDVTWDQDGNTYISDGYINFARRQDRQARQLGEVVGREGHRPRPIPHAPYHRADATTIFMSATAPTGASRCSIRGKFCACSPSTWPPEPGTVATNGNTPPARACAGDRGAQFDLHTPADQGCMSANPLSGAHLQGELDGKVLGVIGKSGRNLKEFSGAHQLACPSENEIYAAEILQLAGAEAAAQPSTT